MVCLDDNEIAALASDSLPKQRAREAQQHVDSCGSCRAALVGAVQALGTATLPVETEATNTSGLGQALLVAPEGYELLSPLGQGGMGEVHAMRDLALKRTVALKRIRGGGTDPTHAARFQQEAQLTAQLEHPNIVPVHALGTLPSGDPFYTMKRARGRTLDRFIAALAAGEEHATPMRLGIMFLQVTQAVAHAHAHGVVHCDLKPANILLGAHGEVLVTDWGLAIVTGAARDIELSHLDVNARSSGQGGTPRYMAPEQRQHQRADARSDVYSLGAVLYELLALTPVPGPDPAPPSSLREVPRELEDVCLKALARDPAARFQSGDALRAALEDALTGVRRRETARRELEEAEAHLTRYRELLEQRRGALQRVAELETRVKPYDNEVQKAGLWAEQEAAEQAALAADEALAQCLELYAAVLGVDPTFTAAADRLADLHLEQFLSAEDRGDLRTAAIHRRHVERHHRGRHAALLKGGGTVQLKLRPGQTAEARALVEKGKRIVDGAAVPLGEPLPMGRYLFTVREPGKVDARISVWLGRSSSVTLRPRLFTPRELGDGFVHVPAGPFLYGGDPVALNSAPRQELELDDFFIARFPVTCGEYLDFLNALGERALPHVPRTKPDGGRLWEPGPGGRFVLPKLDADGNPVHVRAPVMGVSFADAQAYAAWRSHTDGVAYRLPTEEEWEKAARGADGRFFPWGNGFDPAFCKMALSRPGRPQPEPVGSYPADTSIYGMQDCAGAIREWTDSFFDPSRETRVLRGGAWYFNPHYCRLAFRHGYLPHIVFTNFGFRLARSP